MDYAIIKEHHLKLFGPPQLGVKAPGRVNIIGEHIDYNGGMVLPFAIDQHHFLLFGINQVNQHRIHSIGFGAFNSSEGTPDWGKYISETLDVLESKFSIGNIDITIDSNLPIGAGLSSSSALVLGIIEGVNALFDIGLKPNEKINLASEIEYGVGVKGGKMDQTAILSGKTNHSILLDCKTDEITYVGLPENLSWFVVDSDISHDLVESDYNDRRATCDKILALANEDYGTEYLVDIPENSLSYLDINESEMEMAFHVLYEQKRVSSVMDCIENNRASQLGAILNQSHQSLSTLYKVSTVEMDELVHSLQRIDGVLGCRMIGGGFGGSILGLLESKDGVEINALLQEYNAQYDRKASFFHVQPSSGVEIVKF